MSRGTKVSIDPTSANTIPTRVVPGTVDGDVLDGAQDISGKFHSFGVPDLGRMSADGPERATVDPTPPGLPGRPVPANAPFVMPKNGGK